MTKSNLKTLNTYLSDLNLGSLTSEQIDNKLEIISRIVFFIDNKLEIISRIVFFFGALLTVYLSIILVINQLNAQNLLL